MKRLIVAAIAVLSLAAPAFAQSPPKVLSKRDAAAYAAAFAAVREGDFAAADQAKAQVDDPCLLGRLTYLKLMHPDYHAAFDELKAWLAKYKDQPDADKVYALAKKRRPGSALEPVSPGGDTPVGMALVPVGSADLVKPKSAIDPKLQAAREAYYNDGDVQTAYVLAAKSGERWVGGMAAYRLGRYAIAVERFSAVAHDMTQNEWVRSGAAFWAARSSIAAGEPAKAVDYLRLAAKAPYTFYGLIAERQLGLEPAVRAEGYDMGDAAPAGVIPVRATPLEPLSDKALLKFVKADKRAKRAVALAQIGQRSDELEELRLALFASGSDAARRKWRALAQTLGAPLSAPAVQGGRRGFDLSGYPTPDLAPVGGYTLERALVYAIIRQESRFNPGAASAAGAYGLMQMTPATAAYNAGVDAASIDSSLLLDPGTNMRLGQDYVARLLAQTQGDILRTVAAYNAGPRGVTKLAAAMPDADSLLLIESLAGAETRDFVQRVMSNYWIYRQLFSQPSPTLDAAAAGRKLILATWDQTASQLTETPPPPAPPLAAADQTQPQ